jgi:hypothetical protein
MPISAAAELDQPIRTGRREAAGAFSLVRPEARSSSTRAAQR